VLRFDREHVPQRLLGPFDVAARHEGGAEIERCASIGRSQLHGAAIASNGARQVAGAFQRLAEVVVEGGRVGPELDRPPDAVDRGGRFAALPQNDPEEVQRIRIRRLLSKHVAEQGLRFAELPGPDLRHRACQPVLQIRHTGLGPFARRRAVAAPKPDHA